MLCEMFCALPDEMPVHVSKAASMKGFYVRFIAIMAVRMLTFNCTKVTLRNPLPSVRKH